MFIGSLGTQLKVRSDSNPISRIGHTTGAKHLQYARQDTR